MSSTAKKHPPQTEKKMGREIKFRGYHKPTGKMIDLKKITPLALDSNLSQYQDGLFLPFGDNILLEQFTGLKDRNGVEIYEGDVLQEYVMDDLFEIVFSDYANFGLKPLSKMAVKHLKGKEYETIDPSYSETSLTVVGNIHQNPELLP